MGDGGVAQALLADEGQIAVVGIAAGGGPGPFNGLGIGRNVDIEIFQPEVISAAGIGDGAHAVDPDPGYLFEAGGPVARYRHARSEEHTSELHSLMRISYAVFCLKKTNKTQDTR